MGIRVLLTKLYRPCSKEWVSSRYNVYIGRQFCSATPKEVDKTSENVVEDILSDLREPELTEEEILRKRFKSRLSEFIYRKHMTKNPLPLVNTYDFDMKRLRQHYSRYGEVTKINPGICWPTREEILERIHYDKMFEPPLQERIENVRSRRLAEEKCKKEYEDEVDKNMANLDKWVADFHAKNEKKEEKARELRAQREKLVEEISEYLGYDIDPKDPRFKEAVEQRDKEKKKALKAKKQQESYDKMLDKLKKIAQNK